MLTEKQLLERKGYIGASEAAGVLGLSRWDTPVSIWAEKIGLIEPKNIDDKLHVKLGQKLENVICDLFTEETGKRLFRVNETLFHPKYNFLGANIDRRVVGEDAGFEAKSCSAWKAKEWEGEEMPQEYILQCLHSLAVTGKKYWILAVLIGNQAFKWKIIERDEILLSDMIKREMDFWTNYVIPKIMPTVITKYDGDTLDKLFPRGIEGKEITLPDKANQIIEFLQGYEADRKHLDGLIEKEKNELKTMLGDAIKGSTSLYEVKWINSKYSGLDEQELKKSEPDIYMQYYKSKELRRFRYKKLMEGNNGKP